MIYEEKYLLLIFIVGLVLSSKSVLAASNEYSLDYVLEHYNAVAFGANDNTTLNEYNQKVAGTTKGEINGLTVQGEILKRSQAGNVNLDEMYVQVINESNKLVENTEYYINDCPYDFNSPSVIKSPGIYTFNNTCRGQIDSNVYYTPVTIYNYQPDKLYVINFLDTMVENNYIVTLVNNNGNNAYPLDQYAQSNNYTGNVIINFPNAKYVETNGINGTILAPKADVYINTNESLYYQNTLVGSIYANSITTVGRLNTLNKGNKTNSAKVSKELGEDYKEEIKDFTDDAYYGDYSIATMLKNYSIISLGHNNYQSNAKLATYGAPKGSVNVFHIAGPFLIKGDLGIQNYNYSRNSSYYQIRTDMESNEVTEANIGGYINANYGIYRNWGVYGNYNQFMPSKNEIYFKSNQYSRSSSPGIGTPSTFMNYDRLYNTIVQQQQRIPEGTVVTPENGVIRIKIGGTYTIEDVSNVREIIYDDFDSNKDKLTIITIKDSGNVNLPIVTKDKEYKYIVTNDYHGKKVATQQYERNGLLPEDYYGNIVINMPNATFIKLGQNAPFAAHLIAPNADVETTETQIAGCLIVNSFFAEYSTELHFYPITIKNNDCTKYSSKLSTSLQKRLQDLWLFRQLGGADEDIEKVIYGNEAQYKTDLDKIEAVLKCENPDREIIINPETFGNILLIVIIAITFVGGFVLFKKNKEA